MAGSTVVAAVVVDEEGRCLLPVLRLPVLEMELETIAVVITSFDPEGADTE